MKIGRAYSHGRAKSQRDGDSEPTLMIESRAKGTKSRGLQSRRIGAYTHGSLEPKGRRVGGPTVTV